MKAGKAQKRGRPRQEGLVEQRQAEILAEATRLFAEAGYPQADLQVLADRLNVGKGTIYRYFPTKENLFFEAVDAGIRALVEAVDRSLEGVEDPVEHMQSAIRAYLGFFAAHPDLVELLIIERAEFRDREKTTYFLYKDRHHERRKALVEQGIARGLIRDVPPDRVINVVGDCLYGTIFTNHFAKRKIPLEQQAEDIIDLLMNGLFTAKGTRQR